MSDFCEIIVRGHLDFGWSEWFQGLAIAHNDNGETTLSGQIRDQAALYGVIAKVRDMELILISVKFRAGESTKGSSNGISASEDDS